MSESLNTSAITAIAISLAKLTPQEQAIAIELSRGLGRPTDPPSAIEKQRPTDDAKRRPSQKFLHWSEEDTLILMQFEEESKSMTTRERRRKQRQLCRQFGRTSSSVKNKLWKIRNPE